MLAKQNVITVSPDNAKTLFARAAIMKHLKKGASNNRNL